MQTAKEVGWKEIGLEAARKSTGNKETAKLIARWIKEHPKEFCLLESEMIQMFCMHLAAESRHTLSRQVRNPRFASDEDAENEQPKDNGKDRLCKKGEETTPRHDYEASAKMHKQIAYSKWLDGFEVHGKKLRKATRIDMMEYVEHQKRVGKGNFAIAFFVEKLAGRMGGTKKQLGNTEMGRWEDVDFDRVYEEAKKEADGLSGGELSLAGN